MFGSFVSRARLRKATPCRKALSCLLAILVACSFAPISAWGAVDGSSDEPKNPAPARESERDGGAEVKQVDDASNESQAAAHVEEEQQSERPVAAAPFAQEGQVPTSAAAVNVASVAKPEAALGRKVETCTVRLVVSHAKNDAANTLVSTWVDAAIEVPTGSMVEKVLDAAIAGRLIEGYTHGEPYPGFQDYYVDTLTLGGTTYAGTANYSSFWSFVVDGAFAQTGINTTVVHDDMVCELRYVDGKAGSQGGPGTVGLNPDASHPDEGLELPGTPNNAGAVIESVKAPTSSDDVEEAWKRSLKTLAADYVNISDVLLVGGKVYVAASSGSYATGALGSAALYAFDQATGETVGETPLAAPLGFTCRPVYADGIIVVPLDCGRLQGIAAESLTTLWLTDAVSPSSQAASGLATLGGSVFMGTADALDSDFHASAGTLLCVDLLTGALKWKKVDETAGCYWSGIAACGAVLVYGDDAGTLRAVAAQTGEVLSRVDLGAPIRSSATMETGGNTAFVSTVDGRIHRVSVAPDGTLATEGSVSFGATSSSTPTLFEGRLYVGGAQIDNTGVLAVIDAATMQVMHRITALDNGSALPGNVQCAPLVGRDTAGNVLAYVTCNAASGGVYVYRLGDAYARHLYLPQGIEANWCLKSVTMGPDGTLYYTNDSGHLFALKTKAGGEGGGLDHEGNAEGGLGETGEGGGGAGLGGLGGAPVGGYVPAANIPLSPAAVQAAKAAAHDASANREAASVAGTSGAAAGNAATGTDATKASAGDGGGSSGAPVGVNPWAAGGITVGLAGLVGAAGFVMRSHRGKEGAA